jgi:hypothetical protein
MNLYLTAAELSDLTGYAANQVAHMARWLDRNGWPYARDRKGLPRVARSFHDARMSGSAAPTSTGKRPNFAALKAVA